MTAKNLHKIYKLENLLDQYWYLLILDCENHNLNQICSHLENINKIEQQIKNLEENQIINFVFYN